MGGGRNDALPGKAPHSAAEVGGSFVLQYYRTLTTERDNLHKYYKDESIVSRGVEGASPDQITYSAGVEEIREEIRSSAYSGASKTEINCIQSMESKQGGILVQVLGYLVYSESSEKIHFTQVFFLDKQTDPYPGYFVQNDILRYVTGKAEHSEFQAPPLLPPPQPPMLPAPTDSIPPAEADVETPAGEEEEEATPAAEEEVAEEEEEPVMPEVNTVDDSAVAEAVAAAVAAEAEAAEAAQAVPVIPEEKPPAKSWASMAGKLKEGGGTLGPPSKLQGWSLPAPAAVKAKSAVAPKLTAASSTMPVLPPPSAAFKAKAKAAELGQEAVEVRLWVSRIPTEQPPENQELVECFNKLVAEVDENATVEIDRKDLTKDWAYITVWSQEVADILVQHSKDRKVSVRGKILKVQISHDEKPKFPSNSRRSPNNTGKGGGEEGGDAKGADGGAGSRGPRRGKGAKGGNDAGSKGSKGGTDAGSPSDKQAAEGYRPKGGGKRGGEKGKGGGGEGNWRSQS